MDKPPDCTRPLTAGDIETIRRARAGAACSLFIYHRDGTSSVPLEPGKPVVVGRLPPADVVIPDDSLSRAHAQFEIEDLQVFVEDLGSTNGTRVNGEPVQRAPVRPGDEVTLGAITAALVWLAGESDHGLLGHDRFLTLLEYEVQRARAFGRGVAMLMVGAEEPLTRWAPKLTQALRPVDRAALYGPRQVEVLLPEADEAAAQKVAEETGLRCGVAVFPSHAATAGELIEVCWAALRRTTEQAPVMLGPDRSHRSVPSSTPSDVVVYNAAMREVYELVDRVAAASIPVLINGETGTGKELVATAIHLRSGRAGEPICSLNCGAIPPQLVESALFGHERGAFTGADRQKQGVFETANGGTVFLDEIGELAHDAQVALLRVLETGKLTRVGGVREIAVDVRIVAATHRKLEEMVKEGTFRQDLLYRLNTMIIRVPPLRERPDEIEPLATHFLKQANQANQRQLLGFDPDALSALERHDWPGNVRELRNAVERAAVIARGETISLADLPETVRARGSSVVASAEVPEADAEADDLDFKTRVQRFETALIRQALEACGFNQTETSRRLHIPIRTLSNKIKQYGISKG